MAGRGGRWTMAEVCVVSVMLILAVAPSGEGMAVAALEDRRAGLCLSEGQSLQMEEEPESTGVCVLVRPEHTQPYRNNTILSLHLHNTTLVAGMDSFRLWVEVEHQRYSFNETLEKEVWNPLCVGQLHNSTQVWAALRSHFITPSESEEVGGEMIESKLCLGKPKDKAVNAFTGFVGAVSLLTSVPNTPRKCSNIVAEINSTLRLTTSLWDLTGPAFITQTQDDHLCSLSHHDLVFNKALDYNDFYRQCRSLGGRPPNMEEAKSDLVEVETLSCQMNGTNVWWMEDEAMNSEEVTSSCHVLLSNNTMGWRPCISEVPCSLCRVPTNLQYTLYGAIKKFDRYYNLKLTPEGGFYLEGNATSNISMLEGSWVLHSRLHQGQWWLNNNRSWPLGRHLWGSLHQNTLLTLSSCNSLQFSSNDGLCLLRSQRCNEIQDSEDNSDEQDCHNRLIRKHTTYNPVKSPYHDRDRKGSIKINPQVYYVSKITTEEGTVVVQMEIVSKWQDPRVEFMDMKLSRNLFPCKDIWTPTLEFYAGYKDGPTVDIHKFNNGCYVDPEEKQTEHEDFNDPFMGKITPWEKVNLTEEEYIRFLLPCQLRVNRYPFGEYQCNATFYLYEAWNKMEFAPINEDLGNFYSLSYKGDRDLLDYFLNNITIYMRHPRVTLTLHLSGRYEYHLLNSFCPSALMFIISYSTLFFPITDFNERIMGSLTSMLVLAGLFAQASDSYIKTPYFKLLDVWYAILIMLCFGIVIANSLVNSLRIRKAPGRVCQLKNGMFYDGGDKVKREEVNNNSARVCNKICKYVLMAAFITHLVVFVLCAAEIL